VKEVKLLEKDGNADIMGHRNKKMNNDWGGFLKRKTHGVEIDGKEYQMKAYKIPRSKKAKAKGKLGLFAIKDPTHREMYRNVK